MADSGIRLRSNIGNTSVITYNTTSDIPSGKMVGCARASAIGTRAYGMLGPTNDSFATRFRVIKAGTTYSILQKRKVITFVSSFPSYMYVPMNVRGFYSNGYQYKSYTTEYNPGFGSVTFPCPGNYRVNFQADRVANLRGGRRECFGEYCEPAEEQTSIREIGYTYSAFYGIRLVTANGSRKWIAVAHNKPSREYVNDVYSFTLTAAEFGSGPTMEVGLYLASRDGHYWREYGTVCYNPFVLFDFA